MSAQRNNIVVIIAAQDNSGAVLKQLKETLGELKQSSSDSGASVAQLTTKVGGLAVAAAIATKAVHELGAAVTNSLDVGTQLENMSKKTGLSVETLSLLRYTAKLTGEDFDGASRGVAKLDKSIAEAAAGNKEDAALFAQLGLNVKELATAPNAADIAMRRLGQALADTSGPERQGVAMKLLGKSGQDMLPVMIELATHWDYLKQKAQDAGELLSGPQAAALAESNRKLADLKSHVEGAALAFTRGLGPGLNATLNVISGGKGAMQGLVDIGGAIGRALAVATSAAYSLASGLSRVLELDAILHPSTRKKFAGYAEEFDQKARDAMHFALTGKEAHPQPADPLSQPAPQNSRNALHLVDTEGAGKMESAEKERDAALAKLAEAREQAQAGAVKTAGEARLAEIESLHARELISDKEFYARKQAIQRAALDAELKAALGKQAAIDQNIASLQKDARKHGGSFDIDVTAGTVAAEKGHQGDSDAVADQGKLADLLARRLQIAGQIDQIEANIRKNEVEGATQAFELEKKRRDDTDALAVEAEKNYGAGTAARIKQSRDAYFGEGGERQRIALERLGDLTAADTAQQHKEDAIQATGADEGFQQASGYLSARRAGVDAEAARGLITATEAQQKKIDLDRQEAEAMQPVLAAYEKLAAGGDLNAAEKVAELQEKIAELRNPVDEVAAHAREELGGAFEGVFENIQDGTKALQNFAKELERTAEKAVYDKLVKPGVDSLLDKVIPNNPGSGKSPTNNIDELFAYDIGGAGSAPITDMPIAPPDAGGSLVRSAIGGLGGFLGKLGIPGASAISGAAAGKAGAGGESITITLVNNSSLPLDIASTESSGMDKDKVLAIIKNDFDEGGIMRQILSAF